MGNRSRVQARKSVRRQPMSSSLSSPLAGEGGPAPRGPAGWGRATLFLAMSLNTKEAQDVIANAHAKASELGIRVTVAVVDEGGFLIALTRMDGAPPLSPQIAEAKAVGAAMLYRDGGALAELAKDRPGFFSAADRLVRVPIIPGLGSVLVKRDGNVLGAVGVSGGRPEQDLECAEAAISSA